MSAYHLIQLKEAPETSRIGQKWTNEEEEKFIGLIESGKNIEEIAKEHQRTVGGMECRRRHMAVNMLNSKSMEEICNLLQVTQEDIELYQKRRRFELYQKRSIEHKQANTIKENLYDILIDIRKKLAIIEYKLG